MYNIESLQCIMSKLMIVKIKTRTRSKQDWPNPKFEIYFAKKHSFVFANSRFTYHT